MIGISMLPLLSIQIQNSNKKKEEETKLITSYPPRPTHNSSPGHMKIRLPYS